MVPIWTTSIALDPVTVWDTVRDVSVPFVLEPPLDASNAMAMIVYDEAKHLHFEVALLYMNPTVRGRVVEPFEVVGALMVLFSVFTQVMVWATADASRILTIVI